MRVKIFCEGQTEETFVKKILAPEFARKNIFITPIALGGVSKYSILKKRISDLCKSDKTALVTTMLDYYGLPMDTPGKRDNIKGIPDKALHVENMMAQDMQMDNLIPNLILHEFEGLLFSQPEAFAVCNMGEKCVQELYRMRQGADTPEHINDSPQTAPSKRILGLYPEYSKIIDGYNVAEVIGIHKMREQCKHFDRWLTRIEEVASE